MKNTRTCPGCGLISAAIGSHLNRCVWLISLEKFLKYGDVDSSDPDACWMWRPNAKRSPRTSPYGKFSSDRAHRQAYRVAFKAEPGELAVCHTCDTPGCVNPQHLFLGTQKENIQDAAAKGRLYTPFRDPKMRHLINLALPRGEDHYLKQHPKVAQDRVTSMLRGRGIERRMTE